MACTLYWPHHFSPPQRALACGRQRKKAIQMGMAAAYDFKILLPMLTILSLILGAACKFAPGMGGASTAARDSTAPAFKIGG